MNNIPQDVIEFENGKYRLELTDEGYKAFRYGEPWVASNGSKLIGIMAAEIAQLRSQRQAPDGWKLVPVEPTAEMIEASFTCEPGDISKCKSLREISTITSPNLYKAMLAAAPTQPESKPSGEAVAPVCFALMNRHGDFVLWSQDRSVSEYDQKTFWPKTKIVDLFAEPPSLQAAVKRAYEECRDICDEVIKQRNERGLTNGFNALSEAKEAIEAAIPQNAAEALDNYVREKCFEVAKRLDPFNKTNKAHVEAIVNSVLEGGE